MNWREIRRNALTLGCMGACGVAVFSPLVSPWWAGFWFALGVACDLPYAFGDASLSDKLGGTGSTPESENSNQHVPDWDTFSEDVKRKEGCHDD